MSQVIGWICLISLASLCLEVMIYICKDTLKVYNTVTVKPRKKKQVITGEQYDYKNKIAK